MQYHGHAELAQTLALHPAQLSQVINSCAGVNFHELVNGYRIETAKLLLQENSKQKSILDIALDVGFNSKSTLLYPVRQARRGNTIQLPTTSAGTSVELRVNSRALAGTLQVSPSMKGFDYVRS
jgi:AraC-like DNA-binding protein